MSRRHNKIPCPVKLPKQKDDELPDASKCDLMKLYNYCKKHKIEIGYYFEPPTSLWKSTATRTAIANRGLIFTIAMSGQVCLTLGGAAYVELLIAKEAKNEQ